MMLVIVGNKKRPKGAEELKWQDISSEELAALSSTSGLFGLPADGHGQGGYTYILVGAINSDRQEEFLELAEALVESPHTFIFEEEKLLKAPTVALEKAGANIEINKAQKKEEFRFDQYGVATALGSKDKKALWLSLTKAFRAGEKPEALAGLMAWKARQMKDANLSREITFMYHDSHRGAGDLELLLERFALTL